ncbi:metal binding domain of Ada-domain-containing protein [Nemania sp. FL0916]|nr:metal binding domain of Ada-domain-containing protein [Nemania sp. FL0916]
MQNNQVAIPRERRTPTAAGGSSSSSSGGTPSAAQIDEARWQIVLSHTPSPDFLYAVLSTGIFCRTSCPSRRPRRANVRFFADAASAQQAGFRACRRCRPESVDASHASPRASAERQIEIACEYVRQRRGEAQLLDIAAHVGLSPRYLHGLFKQIMGTTPGAYTAAVRGENLNMNVNLNLGQGQRSVALAGGSTPATTGTVTTDSTPTLTIDAVSDPTTPAFDFSSNAGNPPGQLAQIEPSPDEEVSFVNPDHTMDEWFSEALDAFDYADFSLGPFLKPLYDDYDDPNLTGFEGANSEPSEQQTSNREAADYVDPSLLFDDSNAPP